MIFYGIHADIFRKVGFMDEKVFMYYDDTDFCVRLIDNGIKILYVPEAEMWHKVSSSVDRQNSKVQVYYMTRNGLYFRKKYKDKMRGLGNLYANLKNVVKKLLDGGFVHNFNRQIEELPKHKEFIEKMIQGGIKKIVGMGSMHEVGFFEGSILSIEENLHLTCAKSVIIEDGVLITGNVMITDIDHQYTGMDNIFNQDIIAEEKLNNGKNEFRRNFKSII